MEKKKNKTIPLVLSTNGLLDSNPSDNDEEIMSNAVQHGSSISENEQFPIVSNQSITSTEIINNALTDKSLLSEMDFDRMESDDDFLQVADETVSLLVESTTAMEEQLCEEVTQTLDSDQHTVNNETFGRELICEEVIQLTDLEQQITFNQTNEGEFVCEEISEPNSLDQHTPSDQPHEEDAIGPKRLKKPNTSRWIRLSNQGKRKRGEEYHGVKKVSASWHYDVPTPAKQMEEHCNCSFSMKSGRINCNLFQEIERQNPFDQFWKEFGWDQRRTHIQDMVNSLPTKDLKNKQNEVSRREMSLVYNLKLDGRRLRVCNKMFLNTYSITDWVVLNWLKKETNKDPLTNIKKFH
ncbi:uncharacterized protein LOC120351850 isoform X2 [Nilaparvata lugens]|uniref:uncharacterized protein LOC120351850 isoform X2 n=1 Tax=Nilaparvata lugens TaxID=108931 RepID=UPI00193D5F0B|nr:uncharacterized protein LOC120351850 isoform X2 [Nilaparvata lugens]